MTSHDTHPHQFSGSNCVPKQFPTVLCPSYTITQLMLNFSKHRKSCTQLIRLGQRDGVHCAHGAEWQTIQSGAIQRTCVPPRSCIVDAQNQDHVINQLRHALDKAFPMAARNKKATVGRTSILLLTPRSFSKISHANDPSTNSHQRHKYTVYQTTERK